ncbi:hypothetical protein OIO90_004103 [Microbotryomycetes sp. JL221]|nr:hypothetical protein OIO90_004103 [Microbotryomycetes sp. JL221]
MRPRSTASRKRTANPASLALQRVLVTIKQRRFSPRVAAGILIGAIIVIHLAWSASFPGTGRTVAHTNQLADRGVRFDRERDAALSSSLFEFPPLDDLIDRDRLWPPDLEKPICKPTIFVYSLPQHLELSETTVKQCRWSAYNSELLLYKLLQDWTPSSELAQHVTVTDDPAKADLFFVPLFPACYCFECWVKAGWTKTERCGVDEDYIQPIMKWVQSHDSWARNNGADHIIVHPMDFGDGYYTTTSRSAMNATIHLVTVGDNRRPPFSSHFRHFQDLVIPSSTHLINSYHINPMDYLDDQGHPLVEPRGAAAANVGHDPNYPPSTYPEIWSPSLGSKRSNGPSSWFKSLTKLVNPGHETKATTRTITAVFRGGVGNPGEDERYALNIRSLFFPSATGNVSEAPFSRHVHQGLSSLPGYDIAKWSDNDDYSRRLSRSKYGLAPPGYTLDTTRIYEYFAFGVVPVFIGTGHHAGQVLPFRNDFDWDEFTITIPRSQAHQLPKILESISREKYEQLRQNVWNVARLMVLEGKRGNVWKWLARDLCRMRRIGTDAGPDISNN